MPNPLRRARRLDTRTAAPPGRFRRAIGVLLAVVVAAGTVVLIPATANAGAENDMWFVGGTGDSRQRTFGANGTVIIDGTLVYDGACLGGGNPDFLYPATDVYLVAAGSASPGSTLIDAGGDNPNTIVGQASGVFIDETIAFTAPGGKLGAGTYDVVYDVCQDGKFDGDDTVFPNAVTVELPDELPPASGAIAQLKERARVEYQSWLVTHTVMKALFAADKAEAILACMVAPGPACLATVLLTMFDRDQPLGLVNNEVQDRVLNLIMNVAKNQGAIWQDPPDKNFEQLTTLEPVALDPVSDVGSPVADALTGSLDDLAGNAALSESLLHALERYQGAEAAGDAEWGVVQARAVRDLAATLGDHLAGGSALQPIRDAVAADQANIEAHVTAGAAFVDRVATKGFTPQERQNLRNMGKTANEVAALESAIVANGRLPKYQQGQIVALLDGAIAADSAMATTLAETAATWDGIVAQLEQEAGERNTFPVADAGGPYGPKGDVTLDATKSSTPSGTITDYAWDLDGDGEFDDATGATVAPAFAHAGTYVAGLRVTNSAGKQAVDYAVVRTGGTASTPVIDSASPAPAVTATVGEVTAFAVVAGDKSGPVDVSWRLDGDQVETGAGFDYTPAADAVGAHVLTAVVTNGAGGSALRTWRVRVVPADADGDGWTAAPDCDDTRADIHPGRFEVPANGIDDDCNAATPDSVPGGLVGTLWSWGSSIGLGYLNSGKDQYTPKAVTGLSDVVDIEAGDRLGFARLANGQLRSWGFNYRGPIGDGTYENRYTPVTVLGVGGTGVLTGVQGLAVGGEHVIARLGGGAVVAWGSNANGQVGSGSAAGSQPYPVEVVKAGGEKLTGARLVEGGTQSSYAVLDDGSVWSWGVQSCDGTTNIPRGTSNVAVQLPLFDDDVVQLEADHGLVIAREADGRVVSCGGDTEELGRGTPIPLKDINKPLPVTGLGVGSKVVDVVAACSAAFALKEDGSVLGWGHNLNGILDPTGLANQYRSYVPIPVTIPAGAPVVDIEGDGACHVLARRADGSVVVWGNNQFGQGGQGNATFATTGVPNVDFSGGVAIDTAVGNWNSYALVRPADDAGYDRPVQWLTVDAGDAAIGEATGGSVPITLSGPAPVDIEVGWALDGGDSGTVVIPKGATSADAHVAVTDDALDEDDEVVAFRITSVSNGVNVGRRVAETTVVDDDDPPNVSVADVTVAEGDTNLTDVAVTVELSAPSGKDVEVAYGTADGTAGPDDYTGANGVVFFAAGQTTKTVHVSVRGDTTVEADETFAFSLVEPLGARLGRGQATVRIRDDEALTLAVTSPTVTEGDSGTTAATFTVSVTAPPAGVTVTVPWAVQAGTAEIGGDVEGADGTLVLDAGSASAQVTVDVVGDTTVESTEVFRLALAGATASDGRTVVPADPSVATIVDDDVAAPTDQPPVVDAGPNATGDAGSAIALDGTVTDDGTVTTAWTASDATCTFADPAAVDTTITCPAAGSVTVTLTADDGRNAPVSDTATATVTAVEVPQGYEWAGFFQPVDNLPAVNTVQAGQAIPLKFSLGGDRGLDIFAPGYPASVRTACASGAATDAIEETATPGASGLTYDAGSDRYHYVWKTQKAWKGQCRTLVVRLADGSDHTANFRFK